MAAAVEALLLELPEEIEQFVTVPDPDDAAPTDEPAAVPAVSPSVAAALAAHRADAERRYNDLENRYQAAVDELSLWRDREAARIEREIKRLDLCLFGVLDAELARNPKRKSLALPFGVSVRRRAQPPTWERDEDALLAWALEHSPEYVVRVPKLRWAPLKAVARALPDGRAVLPDGEVLPTVQVVQRPDVYAVEVKAGG